MKNPSVLPPRPETRSVTLSMKVKPSIAGALGKAAKANARSKASVVETVLEQWLKANRFLK
ncbi:MAG TPA: hypothetical protein VGP28_04365 [Methylocella sp.]|jgi:hypothetical protein|nr:hypothetical protein [Methylocella sp.]